jgi:hypothetical protein
MNERNFNRNAFARAVFFFFQTQTLSLSLSLSRRTEQQGSEKTFSTTTTTNAHSPRGMVPTTLSFYPKSISPKQKSDDRADARDDDVNDDTKSAKREFETTKTVTYLLCVLDHHRWGSPRRTRTHHHHLVLDVYKLFCFSVVLKVTTTFRECTKRRGRKQRKRSERTNGPQNKGRREFFTI